MRVVPLHNTAEASRGRIPATIGKYRIIDAIGHGAMGVVYKARDPEIGRDVAIKLLRAMNHTHPHDAADAFKRFKLEARSAGNLRHPNIITVFEASQETDRPYIVMEFVAGEGLDRIIARERRIAPQRVLDCIRQIAAGLDYAHAQGVIHRDIKASNILISTTGSAFILDFGVASMSKRIAGTIIVPDDDPEIVVGTPAYMSPEQIKNDALDGRADLFSLAVLAFECLTGKLPFQGETATGLMRNIIAGKRRPLGAAAPELPVALEFVFERALAVDRTRRFSTAGELVEALAKALSMDNTPPEMKSDAPLSFRKRESGNGASSSQTAAAPRATPPQQTSTVNRVEPPHRAMNDDMLARPAARAPRSFTPGSLFADGAPPSLRKPVGRGKPDLGLMLARYRREIYAGVFALCVVTPLVLFLIFGIDARSIAPASAARSPDTAAPAQLPPAELHSELHMPRVDDAPLSQGVTELTNRELLGVLVRKGAPESRILEALTTAAERRLPEFVDASVYALRHESSTVRLAAVRLVGESLDRRIVPELVLRIDDGAAEVRASTARALAQLGDRRALSFLSARYFSETDETVRSAIKRAIERLSGLPFTEANLVDNLKR